MGWQLRHTRVPTTGHATGVNVTGDTFCLLEEQRVTQKKERKGVCSLVWRPGVSRSTPMGLLKTVLMQGTVLGAAPAGWLWDTGRRWAGQDSCRAAGCWLLLSSHLWHWRVDLSLAQGTASHVLHVLLHLQAEQGEVLGLRGSSWVTCDHWFSSPTTPCGPWVKHN